MNRDRFFSNFKVPKEESQKFVDIVTSKGASLDKNFKSRYIVDKSKIKEICVLINKEKSGEVVDIWVNTDRKTLFVKVAFPNGTVETYVRTFDYEFSDFEVRETNINELGEIIYRKKVMGAEDGKEQKNEPR